MQFIQRGLTTLSFVVALLGFLLAATPAQAINVSGTISTDTTWTTADSPVILTGNTTVSGATLTIDPGVQVRSSGNYELKAQNSATIDVNGTSGSTVLFTHNTSTSANAWGGIEVDDTSTLTMDYATVQYSAYGIQNIGGAVTVNDSTFSTNQVGIAVRNNGSLTTNRNTFNKNTVFPVEISPDSGTITFGSGADADSLGAGADANGYNAIGIGHYDHSTSSCPAGVCSMPKRNFAGITNIPYLNYEGYTISGEGNTLQIDAGVIFKFYHSYKSDFTVDSGADLDINGTDQGSNAVYITDNRDDTIGGDTNNDGSASSPATHNNATFTVTGNGSTATIDFARISYIRSGTSITNEATATIQDTIYATNSAGISVNERASLTTARNHFWDNTWPVDVNPDVTSVTFGSGANQDNINNPSTGTDSNTYKGIGVGWDDDRTADCPSDVCTFSQRTFAGISNIPYVFYENYNVDNDTLNIDAGVILKWRGSTDDELYINNGADLNINGTSGSKVYFTDVRDDTIGGDTNNDGSATTPSTHGYREIWVRSSGSTATITHTEFRTPNVGVIAYDGATVSVSDSLFDDPNIGIVAFQNANLTTARNTFKKANLFPVEIDPDVGTVNFGSGADVDILGTGSDLNAYNAIGMGSVDDRSSSCPAGVCAISQRTFAGISNIPYVVREDYRVSGSGNTFQIDAGIVIKLDNTFYADFITEDSAVLDINGTEANPVIITSVDDDTAGGDTNNNGSSTTPSTSEFREMLVYNNATATIDYLEFRYSNSLSFYASSTGTIQDSTFDSNNVGINVYDQANLTTARNTFTNQVHTPISINPAANAISFGTGADVDMLGTGADANAHNAIGLGFRDARDDICPSNVCQLPQRTFAGISNIPYRLYEYMEVRDADGTFQIDEGVIIKYSDDTYPQIKVYGGATLDINGTFGNQVKFTSQYDDTIGGDSNNDGSATSPIVRARSGVVIESANTHNIDFLDMHYADYGIYINNASANLTVNDSNFNDGNNGFTLQNFGSLVLNRNNFLGNSTWGIDNNTAKVVSAENQYWNAADGPTDNDTAAGSCSIGSGISANGSGDNVTDDGTNQVDYCPFSTTQHIPNSSPTASTANISGAGNFYAGSTETLTAIYSDVDGASDLDTLYLKIDHPTATDIEYYASEGSNASGLTATAVTGSEYVESITYDRSSSGNNLTIVWHITLDWDWTENSNIELGVKSIDDDAADSGYATTTSLDLTYENDLTTTGTLTATSATNGSLSSGDWVPGSDTITWSGLTVVYEGTTTVYPPDSDFDVQVVDDDDGTWTDSVSSGATFSVASTTDATTDEEDIHTVTITNIPSGGSDVSSNSFTIKVDADTPTISGAAVTPADTSAAVVWTTDEAASTQILYGVTSTSLNQSTTQIDTSPRVTSHSQSLTPLTACTQYFYRLRSVDRAGNTVTTAINNFFTTGCTGSTQIEAAEEQPVTAATGGTTTLTTDSKQIQVSVPANATNVDVTYQVKKLAPTNVITTTGTPTAQKALVGELVYNLQAYTAPDTTVTMFNDDITISATYTDADVSGYDESTLVFYRWDGSQWNALDSTVNTATNTITATTSNFSDFGVFGEEAEETSSGSSSDPAPPSNPEPTTPVCTLNAPVGAPYIFAIEAESASSLRVHYSNAEGPKDAYTIIYGPENNRNEHSAVRVVPGYEQSIVVHDLLPSTRYYFRVRADNGCAPGPWSNELSARTRGLFPLSYATKTLEYSVTPADEVDEDDTADEVVDTKTPQEEEPAEAPITDRISEDTTDKNVNELAQVRHTVKVTIVDENQEPRGGVEVTLHSDPKHGVTDEQGLVTFENVEPGEHRLIVMADGFTGEQALAVPFKRTSQIIETTVQISLTKTIYWPFYVALGVIGLLLAVILWLVKSKK